MDTEAGALQQAPLMAAALLLADRGIYGLIWLDETLHVRARFGRLVEFVNVGEPATHDLWPLIGLENDIAALRNTPGSVLSLPAVSIVTGEDATPRLNITFLWSEGDAAYLAVVSRANSKSDLEIELSRQARARLMAEAEVTRKSIELARANRELEEYASIISHDLNAPLRKLRLLAGDLEGQLESPAAPEVSGTLAQLREQSVRMSAMMSALLEYSSIGRKEAAIGNLDTRALVTAIESSVHRPKGLKVEIEGYWPVIRTLAAPLDLVLRNLIANAIRHHDRETGIVSVCVLERPAAYEFTVADDGPGILPAHHEAIFLPFRKLDAEKNPDGQGMGLSLVKRTVESVGGTISLRSNPARERGTVFVVSWPKVATE